LNKVETFAQFLAAQSTHISPISFSVNLLLAALLSYVLGKVYIQYGTSLSNRVAFSRNFVLITMTTMLVISIVKSSLSLSLGLVGALSIVRFRTAIKDPEELSYVFLTIALGLGFGANQVSITCLGFVIILAMIIARNFNLRQDQIKDHSLVLNINSELKNSLSLNQISDILKAECQQIKLKHHGEKNGRMDSSFVIECKDTEQITNIQNKLKKEDDQIELHYFSLSHT